MDFQTLLTTSVGFLNGYIIPLLIAIAFLVFLWNTYVYFIQKSNEPEARERAKRHALWSVIAFLLFILFWGIINVATAGFGIARERPLCPDIPGFPCFGSPLGSSGTLQGEYECTELIFGMQWCSRGETVTEGFGFEPGTQIPVEEGSDSDWQPFGSDCIGDSADGSTDCGYTTTAANGTETNTGSQTNTAQSTSPYPWSYESASSATESGAGITEVNSESIAGETCSELMIEPRSAAFFDTEERAYVLYTDANGTERLVDVTLESDETSVTYDEDKIEEIRSTGRDLRIMHTHPKSTTEVLGISVRKAPSIADFNLQCRVQNDLPHYVIDGETIWRYEQTDPGTHCPYTTEEEFRRLGFAEAYGILAELPEAERGTFIDQNIQAVEANRNPLISESAREETIAFLNEARDLTTDELKTQQLNLLLENGIRLKEVTESELCDDSTSV